MSRQGSMVFETVGPTNGSWWTTTSPQDFTDTAWSQVPRMRLSKFATATFFSPSDAKPASFKVTRTEADEGRG